MKLRDAILFEHAMPDDSSTLLEESFKSRVMDFLKKVFPSRTKIALYQKSKREYIAMASKDDQNSLMHVMPGQTPVTMDRISEEEANVYIGKYRQAGYVKVRAARDIAGAITRLGPAIASYAITGSLIAIGWGSIVYILSQHGQSELDRISQEVSVDMSTSLEALSKSFNRDLDIALDEYVNQMSKELADKYRDMSLDVPTGAVDKTIDIDALLQVPTP